MKFFRKENTMPGSLNDILSEPISKENEIIILDFMKRKMTVCADLAVELLSAMEKRFGPEVRKVVKEMAKNQEFPSNEDLKGPEEDLKEFCNTIDEVAIGSHMWEKVISEPDRVGYNFTRCMYAEIFGELGEPDLGWVICARDEPWAKSYNPKIQFKRTETLMEGNKVCNHIFYVEK